MSYYDAYVGIGGNYATVADALADSKHNICVLSNTVEVNPWIFSDGATQITIEPTAIILYNGLVPLIQTSSTDNFYITINNSSMVVGSEFISSTPLNINSFVKFNSVTLNFTADQSYFASSNLYIYDCIITNNATYLISYDGTNVVLSNSTVFGNIFLSNQSFSNVSVKLDTNIIYSTLAVYPNEALSGTMFKDIRDKVKSTNRVGAAVGYPAVYTITNNKIGVLSLISDTNTASYFAGLTLVNNQITSMNAMGNATINIIFSTISNNTFEETNMSNTEFNSWTNVLISTIASNTFLGPLRLGDMLYTTISDNLFDVLEIGSTDPTVGSIDLSKITDNIMAALTINLGINIATDLSNNIIGSDLIVQGSMSSCTINYNVLGNLTFQSTMKYNTLINNNVTSINYIQALDSDIIKEHLNLVLNCNGTVNNLTLKDNTNLTATFNSLVTKSKFLANYNAKMKFTSKVISSIFMNNDGYLGFKDKVYSTQIAYNNKLSLKFHEYIKRCIINYNIMRCKLDIQESCCSIVEHNL
jgi:hypothetical protein